MERVPVGVVFVLLLMAAATAAGAERPNVLLILTDDQGFGDVGSHGNSILQTPNLDQLAESGARFDRFFVSPVCAPTRASLLTGRYHMRTGVSGVTRGLETMRDDEWTLAEMFRSAGYATGAFGKWHNGRHMPFHPNGQGFDTFYGFCGGHWNTYFDPPLERNGEPVRGRGFITDDLTNQAIAFIRANRSRPFFCYLPYNTPHSPWRAPDSLWSKYDSRGLDVKAQAAYAMVDSIDQNVGRLLAALDELQLADNTIVLFLTDNGANSDRFNAGMKGRKGSIDEGGTRVPLFVRFPGAIKPKTLIKRNAFHLDILPTLAEWCGVTLPTKVKERLDGRSLAPLLVDPAAEWADRDFFTIRYRLGQQPAQQRGAVRTDRWRATRSRGRWRLYDMLADPGQKKDVAQQHPETVEQLAAKFDAWLEEVTAKSLAPPPIPLGHAERSRVELPANEAELRPGFGEGIRWTGDTENGFANCWIHDWTSNDAYPEWRVNFLAPGRYRFTLEQTCHNVDVGCQLRLEVGETQLSKNLGFAVDVPLMRKPDRLYSSNYQDKLRWGLLEMGELQIDSPGERTIRLRTKIARDQSIDLRRIWVEKLKD